MTAKKYLEQAFYLDKHINSLLLQKQDLKSKALNVSSGSGNSGGGNGVPDDRISPIVAKIVDMEADIDKKIDRYVELKREIADRIESLENERHRLVLKERYINFKKGEQIAVDNSIDLRWMYRLRASALKVFSKKYNFQ